MHCISTNVYTNKLCLDIPINVELVNRVYLFFSISSRWKMVEGICNERTWWAYIIFNGLHPTLFVMCLLIQWMPSQFRRRDIRKKNETNKCSNSPIQYYINLCMKCVFVKCITLFTLLNFYFPILLRIVVAWSLVTRKRSRAFKI